MTAKLVATPYITLLKSLEYSNTNPHLTIVLHLASPTVIQPLRPPSALGLVTPSANLGLWGLRLASHSVDCRNLEEQDE